MKVMVSKKVSGPIGVLLPPNILGLTKFGLMFSFVEHIYILIATKTKNA
jgi:hypothetical protein